MGTELKAQQIKGLNQSINDSSTRINALKQELKTTTTKEGRTQIKNKIDRLNKVQSELKAELKKQLRLLLLLILLEAEPLSRR